MMGIDSLTLSLLSRNQGNRPIYDNKQEITLIKIQKGRGSQHLQGMLSATLELVPYKVLGILLLVSMDTTNITVTMTTSGTSPVP